jgi:hypothetical protein
MKRGKTLSAWFKRAGGIKGAKRHRFTEPIFEPHTKEIGRLLLAWNDLHERLATLFATTLGTDLTERSFALWHSVRNDQGKRRLLRAAVQKLTESEIGRRDKLVDEIIWILDKADILEGYRDDSAHTPLQYVKGDLLNLAKAFGIAELYLQSIKVTPNTSFQNPRASNIEQKQKDLLIEHKYARERVLVLRDYVIAIDHAWSNAGLPWPSRPSLPERKPNRVRRRKDIQRRR